MKTVTIVASACLFGAVSAAADDTVGKYNLEVRERLAALEQLDVTAEKKIDPATEQNVDVDVAAILAAAEIVED